MMIAPAPPDDHALAEIERMAVTLADLAGARIRTALGRSLGVRYKTASGLGTETQFRDPVSEVDEEVERLVRGQVGISFPDHDVLGEESAARAALGHDIVWAIDPIDGTVNFVNGLPFFAASIGVLWRGEPVVGAIWCSTSHALRAGVYHARRGGVPRFDFEAVDTMPNPAVRRRLAGFGAMPAPEAAPQWDFRRTGSAALECAFVAAGLLDVVRFDMPNVWDVAAGAVLVQAASGDIRVKGQAGWVPFSGFLQDGHEKDDLRKWNCPTIIGQPDAVAAMVGLG